MRYAEAKFALQSAPGLAMHLLYPERAPALAERFGEICERSFRPPAPPEILEFEDVILTPERDRDCLYDANGNRIEASCVLQFDEDLAASPWRAAARLENAQPQATVREPVVYQSVMFTPWGHFLLESLARAWGTQLRPDLAELPSIFAKGAAGGRYEAIEQVLDLAGLRPAPPLPETGAVRFAKCYVPTASFALGGYADANHLLAPRRVAARLIGAAKKAPEPVYLSRSSVASKRTHFGPLRNELEFEARLQAEGVRIVHLQRHSLAEQVAIVNSHDVFIGPWGSALHNSLFRLDGREMTTFVLSGRFVPTNFLMIDSIVGNSAHYLMTLERPADFDIAKQQVIDIDATMAYLRRCGVL